MGPPITFLMDGKQYIALMGGTGGTTSPGQTGQAGPPPRQKPQLLVFGLDGNAELPKATSTPVPAPTDPH
jgi:hypothetical protein